ncbi:ABC transporter ATP-binding protein [Micromonospora sp. NBC_00898]|uniref:ABC transporter ATP-binding protein n=1 Tax=Micromonospora sp. NBC_00898 TaxID=2975981 RepID=UPI00386A01EB|nr:ABC transporter ATP-binding protein [Micromonospora sp. NBC_00898]
MLAGATVSVPANSVVALVGPNGAGKTTLLHLAVGVVPADAGRVTVFGVSPRAATARGDVGFVAGDKPLYRRFRVSELLRMGAALNPRWDQRYAAQRLDSLGIDLRKRAGSLSGGEQAQMALTLALAKRPRLLLLDEPGAALDPLARRAFLDDVSGETSARGITVVHSSHDVSELDRACDHLVVVRRGTVVHASAITDLIATGQGLEDFILRALGGDRPAEAAA